MISDSYFLVNIIVMNILSYITIIAITSSCSGNFERLQFIETPLGATNVVSFQMGGNQYLAFNRLRAFRRYQSGTQIYKMDEEGSFTFYQTLKSTYNGPGRPCYFQIASDDYIAIPYFARSSSGKRAPRTVVFSSFDGYFDVIQELDGGRALSVAFIVINSTKMLVTQGYQKLFVYTWRRNRFAKSQVIKIAKRAYVTEYSPFITTSGQTYMACAVWGGRKNSFVLKWNGARFYVHQTLQGTEYAMSAEITVVNGEIALILAQRQNGFRAKMNFTKPLWTWKDSVSRFALSKTLSIKSRGASACRHLRINNDLYLAVSQTADKKSLLYKYRDGRFVLYQEFKVAFADDLTVFTYNRVHFVAMATSNVQYSPVFIWN